MGEGAMDPLPAPTLAAAAALAVALPPAPSLAAVAALAVAPPPDPSLAAAAAVAVAAGSPVLGKPSKQVDRSAYAEQLHENCDREEGEFPDLHLTTYNSTASNGSHQD